MTTQAHAWGFITRLVVSKTPPFSDSLLDSLMPCEVGLCSDMCQNLFLKDGIILQMISHRSKLRLPKADYLVVYCKDPLQGLFLGFYRNILALVVLCPPQVLPSLTVASVCDTHPSWHMERSLSALCTWWPAALLINIFLLLQDLILSHPIIGNQKWLPLRKKVLCVKDVNMLRGGLAPCFHFWLYRCFWRGQKKAPPPTWYRTFSVLPA